MLQGHSWGDSRSPTPGTFLWVGRARWATAHYLGEVSDGCSMSRRAMRARIEGNHHDRPARPTRPGRPRWHSSRNRVAASPSQRRGHRSQQRQQRHGRRHPDRHRDSCLGLGDVRDRHRDVPANSQSIGSATGRRQRRNEGAGVLDAVDCRLDDRRGSDTPRRRARPRRTATR